MPEQILTQRFRIFFSSPGDVSEERAILRQVADSLPRDSFLKSPITLDTVDWDRPGSETAMPAHLTPQEAVNRQLAKPSDCDVVIVILWSRMGTPVGDFARKQNGEPYLSGTEWEFDDAIKAAKDAEAAHASIVKPVVLLYYRTDMPTYKSSDPDELQRMADQLKTVQAFIHGLKHPAGSSPFSYHLYQKPAEFKEMVVHHLKQAIEKLSVRQAHRVTNQRRRHAKSDVRTAARKPDGQPFPGLRPFRAEDSDFFFGRDRETQDLINVLR